MPSAPLGLTQIQPRLGLWPSWEAAPPESPLATYDFSSTQVSLLPLPHDCLGDLALIPCKMAWLVVMRLELWVGRGCPPQLSFPGAYELPACASPASGTVPLAPVDSCGAAWPCSNIVGGGMCGVKGWGGRGHGKLPQSSVCSHRIAIGSASFFLYFFVYNTSYEGEGHAGIQSLVHLSNSAVQCNLGDRKESHSFIHPLTHSVHL